MDLSGDHQIAFYDDGVGTSGFRPLRLLGGMFGWGLSRNVRDLYLQLCEHYRHVDDGEDAVDHIYIFGFSRGAFTARTLEVALRWVDTRPRTWPPASHPCATRTSAPVSTASRASVTEPTCCSTIPPAWWVAGKKTAISGGRSGTTVTVCLPLYADQ